MGLEPKPIFTSDCPTPAASFVCVTGLAPSEVQAVEQVVQSLRLLGDGGGRHVVRSKLESAVTTAIAWAECRVRSAPTLIREAQDRGDLDGAREIALEQTGLRRALADYYEKAR